MLSKGPSKRSQSVLDFALHLQRYLNRDAGSSPQAFPDVAIYLEVLPLPRRDLSPAHRVDFDRIGVSIWNTCSKLIRSDEEHPDAKTIAKARTFAYLILESAASSQRKAQQRNYRGALKAAKECLYTGLLDLGAKIIEQLAAKQEFLSQSNGLQDVAQEVPEMLHIQYLLLRIILAWKQNRLELAEHFYFQLESLGSTFTAHHREQLGDLCYEIGNEQLTKDHTKVSKKWLQRGCHVCDLHAAGALENDTSDLRLNLMHAYVRCLLASTDSEANDEAPKALQSLHEEFGHKLSVMLLQLEFYGRDLQLHLDAYFAALMAIIRTVPLMVSNHKLVLHHVHQLKNVSLSLAAEALKIYIVVRLAPQDEDDWIEASVVILVWLVTTDTAHPPSSLPMQLEAYLGDVYQAWGKVLSPQATHGALVLFWKRIEGATADEQRELIPQWCRVALHQMLSNASDHNIGKLERRMIKCFIDLSDFEAASQTFEQMTLSRKNHHLSRYLWYSLALRHGYDDTVQSALSGLAIVHDDRNRLLFAAVAETITYSSKKHGAQLLQRILDKYNDSLSPEIDVPSLLRSTVRLLLLATAEVDDEPDELVSRLCGAFRSAVRFSQKGAPGDNAKALLTLKDCKWFEKISYNAALENFRTWPKSYIIDLLHYSSQIQYPDHVSDLDRVEKLVHESNATNAQTILYLTEARSLRKSATIEDIPRSSYSGKSPPSLNEIQITLYRNVFDRYSESRQRLSTVRESPLNDKSEILTAMEKKLVKLVPLAFESILFLAGHPQTIGHPEDEVSLSQIIDDATRLNATQRTYSLIADVILYSTEQEVSMHDTSLTRSLPISITVKLLAELLHRIRNLPDYDVAQASRWIRCIVQVFLDRWNVGTSIKTTSSILNPPDLEILQMVKMIAEQALELVRTTPLDGNTSRTNYPAEELEWLATTFFNVSIDLHMAQSQHQSTPSGAEAHNSKTALETSTCFPRHKSSPSSLSAVCSNNPGSWAPPGTNAAGTTPKHGLTPKTLPNDDNVSDHGGCESVTSPQIWASLAVELAHLLDANLGSSISTMQRLPGVGEDANCCSRVSARTMSGQQASDNCNGGALAAILRERCRMLEWEI